MKMAADQYRAALATLGLSQQAAGRWLGVSSRTAIRYASEGPSGPAARAVSIALAVRGLEVTGWDGLGRGTVRHADVVEALGVGR